MNNKNSVLIFASCLDLFLLECGISIIYVSRIPVKILNKTSACAELFLPSVVCLSLV